MISEALKSGVMNPQAGTTEHTDLSGIGSLAGPRMIRGVLLTSAWFGGLVALAAWVYLEWTWALGFAGGAVVGGANLLFLTALVREVVTPHKRKPFRIVSVLSTKVVVVYGGLAALLLWNTLPTLSVVAGFSLVLFVITLKSAGRALLASGVFGGRTDRNEADED